MIVIDILAYVSVGIITIGWLFSIIYEFVKKAQANKETKETHTE